MFVSRVERVLRTGKKKETAGKKISKEQKGGQWNGGITKKKKKEKNNKREREKTQTWTHRRLIALYAITGNEYVGKRGATTGLYTQTKVKTKRKERER